MTAVTQRKIKPDEDGLRLDRWFARHSPQLTHGRLEKLLRTGQVRVDGARVKANPDRRRRNGPHAADPRRTSASARRREKAVAHPQRQGTAHFTKCLVLYREKDVIALNKPPGLAVQGGTKTSVTSTAVAGLVGGGADRPRLVHRLDRDTSGVLVVAAQRTRAAASLAPLAFRGRDTQKIYWALYERSTDPRAPARSTPR